jgi:hypothetical protein
MNNKQRKTLTAILEKPTRSDILWADIESLFIGLGADVSEGKGSRVNVKLNGVVGVFHRPHPRPETKKYMVENVRDFLGRAGVIKNE